MKEDFLIQSMTEIIAEMLRIEQEKECGIEDMQDIGLYVL